ncbi:MAG: hypothetical protein CSB33_04690 [Desulfobacterales bacterium]|nr:MAG: hypothetical protein CSB33_04690 [Desulfobacterales bacterium]
MMKPDCIDIDMIFRYIDGNCSRRERDRLEGHFSLCEKCRKELVDAYELSKETDESLEWDLASPAEIDSVMRALSPFLPLKKIYKWAKKKIPLPAEPGFSPLLAPVRSSTEFEMDSVLLTKDIGDLKTEFQIEKAEGERVNIRVAVSEADEKAENVRATFKRKGGGTFSRPLTGEYGFFENMPFGYYRFTLKQNAVEKSACFIEIGDEQVTVTDD